MSWSCTTCTVVNAEPHGLVCNVCGAIRGEGTTSADSAAVARQLHDEEQHQLRSISLDADAALARQLADEDQLGGGGSSAASADAALARQLAQQDEQRLSSSSSSSSSAAQQRPGAAVHLLSSETTASCVSVDGDRIVRYIAASYRRPLSPSSTWSDVEVRLAKSDGLVWSGSGGGSSSSSSSSSSSASASASQRRRASGKGWACGYRNIQLLWSNLGAAGSPYASALAHARGGAGDGGGGPTRRLPIPSIHTLQLLIEQAWAAGFDAKGASELGGRLTIPGDRQKWIGTAEAVVLFRSLGVPLEMAVFKQPSLQPRSRKRSRGESAVMGSGSTTGRSVRGDGRSCGSGSSGDYERQRRAHNHNHPSLIQFAWRYFGGDRAADTVVQSSMPPLYLQHAGHSRSIVGVERRRASARSAWHYVLLLFDPSTVEKEENRSILVAMAAQGESGERDDDHGRRRLSSGSATARRPIKWAPLIKRLQGTALTSKEYEIMYLPQVTRAITKGPIQYRAEHED